MRKELRFGWVIPDVLAGSALPVKEDLPFLRDEGIRAIVSAMEESPDLSGFSRLHLPVVDQRAPTHEQMDAFVTFVDANCPTLVHCTHGVGRTATFLCAYIIRVKHRTAKQAINYVAANRFGRGRAGPSTATRVQEAKLASYELLCRGREKA